MTTRIYLPLSSTGLADLVAEARVEGPVSAHAVTKALREAWPQGDEEEWEYAALAAAADHSRALRSKVDTQRRYVIAADVHKAAVAESAGADEPTAVIVEHDVIWKNIASLQMDTEDDPGPEHHQELAWFATQEIRDLH